MPERFFERTILRVTIGLVVLAMFAPVWAQHTQGRINVTVLDPQSAIVEGATLTLVDLATNETRTGETQSVGTYSFSNLPAGRYKLTVAKPGFKDTVYDQVTVEGTKATDIKTILQVGSPTETMTIEAVTPVVETTQVAIGTVIDMKHIEGLPILGRDISGLARIVPGYTGSGPSGGTWNGLPSIAQGNNVDGVVGSTSRMKFGGNSTPSVQVRLENIEEMTVQTDQLDMNQGFGQAAMQSNFTTRRGTNEFHGEVFWDHRNDDLNANTWYNNARGVKLGEFKLNEFGGTIGGPIMKDKLFFFFSLSTARQPGGGPFSNTYLLPAAQQGNYTYVGEDGATHTVNLFTAAHSFDASLPTTVNSVIGSQMSRINSAIAAGSVASTTDPNINSVSWIGPNSTKRWFETFRVDYTPTEKWRFNIAVNRTTTEQPNANAPFFPGADFSAAAGGNKFDNFTSAVGIEWTVSPTLLNSFRFGYLYPTQFWSYNSSPDYSTVAERVYWPLVTTPQDFYVPISTFYPIFNISDTVNWQKGAHSLNFGFSGYREQDHYWNPPELTNVYLGLAEGDPALQALTNVGGYEPLPSASESQMADAQSLYALLTGRITYISGSFPYDPATGDYIQQRAKYFPLNEVAKAAGLFVQDSWRVRPGLTVNAGLRWDFTVASHDKQNAYHNADESSLWGPSGIGNLFKPGTLTGNLNPTLDERPIPFQNWYVSPQPALGIAWNPKGREGFLGRLIGGGDTVIRASVSLRNFTVPYQYFWNTASDYGSFFYQFYQAEARNLTGAGSFAPGSLKVGDPYPAFLLSPQKYQRSVPMAQFTFNNDQFSNGSNGMEFNIGQPYTLSWTMGIQRKLGESRAIEIRYNGNRSLHQWISMDLNEVNVFENGFLQEFKNAQKNLAINGGSSFGNINPAGGTVALPILTAAFTGSRTGDQADPLFSSGSFITQLNTGQVGGMAATLTGIGAAPYFCNLVGDSFGPCATTIGYTGPGGGYPINFFQVNPYATGIPSIMMTDAGWSTYNALQVDFRQRLWHGLEFDANYTWSHTLGVSTPNDWTGSYYAYTLRNLHNSYGPTRFDLRHVFNLSGTFDLPFGAGQKYLSQTGVLDKVFGGWSIGTITTYRTGFPFRLLGGRSTFNNIGDGGVILNGVTVDELQNAIGVFKSPNVNYVQLIDPNYRKAGVGANTQFMTANTTPGTFAPTIWLHGPGGFESDLSVTKHTAITETTRFTFQAQFLNVFNHPIFGVAANPVGSNVRSSSWATTSGASNQNLGYGRIIELRANISF